VIQRCLDQGLRLAVPGGVTITHAEDVAPGLFLAMQCGRPGERYILGGDRIVLREYFSLIADECGRPRPLLTLRAAAVIASSEFQAMCAHS
jgi:dihydroflavonol-4-reductase